MSERLQKCFEAGDVTALFPLMREWPESELRALMLDIEDYCKSFDGKMDLAYKELAFKPENFVSTIRSLAVDEAVRDVRMDNEIMCSEIASVALFYLAAFEGANAERREHGGQP